MLANKETPVTLENVVLTPEQETYVRSLVDAGEFADAGEVMRAALDMMAISDSELDDMIKAGFESGIAEGDVFAEVREELGLRVR